MKYLLVKEYPGSPELGTIVMLRECGAYDKYQGYCLEKDFNDNIAHGYDSYEVENYPEFWRPESEWISSLTNSPKGSLHWLNTNMGFILRVGEAISTKELPSNYYVDWGKRIEEIAKETMEHFKDKLK